MARRHSSAGCGAARCGAGGPSPSPDGAGAAERRGGAGPRSPDSGSGAAAAAAAEPGPAQLLAPHRHRLPGGGPGPPRRPQRRRGAARSPPAQDGGRARAAAAAPHNGAERRRASRPALPQRSARPSPPRHAAPRTPGAAARPRLPSPHGRAANQRAPPAPAAGQGFERRGAGGALCAAGRCTRRAGRALRDGRGDCWEPWGSVGSRSEKRHKNVLYLFIFFPANKVQFSRRYRLRYRVLSCLNRHGSLRSPVRGSSVR